MQWSSLFLYSAVSVLQPTGGERDNILPSWSSTTARHGIVESIERMARAGSPEYVKLDDRVAVLVGDGALWSDALAGADNEVRPPEAGDSFGSFADYSESVRAHLSLRGPKAIGATYREFAFQPLKELVGLLKEHHFQIWVLSFGDHEVDRTMAELNYGLPRFRVIEVTPHAAPVSSTDLARTIWERIGTVPQIFLGRSHSDLGLLKLAGKGEGVLKIQISASQNASTQTPDSTPDDSGEQQNSWSFVVSPEEHWLRKYSWQAPSERTYSKN